LDQDKLAGRLFYRIIHARGLMKVGKDIPKPYCKVNFKKPIGEKDNTGVVEKNTINPIW